MNILTTFERKGQQPPWEGDLVKIVVTLGLPIEKNGEINEEYSFGSRLYLFERPLYGTWGDRNDEKTHRIIRRVFTGATYAEATAQARAYLDGEIKKLTDMLSKRKAALDNAG